MTTTKLDRVETYYNITKQCLSYRTRWGKVEHARAMVLNDVKFAVQPAGRYKVITDRRKNVHAFVRGEMSWVAGMNDNLGDFTLDNMARQGYNRVTYNPYKHESFVVVNTGEPIYSATQVVIVGNAIFLSGKDTSNANVFV
jgi:hypothetical protein